MERISTGIPELDRMLKGGIPKGFLVAVVGEPGCGKTIFCLHFVDAGLRAGDKAIFVTTEESAESIVNQAAQFGMDFRKAWNEGKLIIIDAFLRPRDDPHSLYSLDVEELVNKVISAKRRLGYGHTRLVIDSLSAFWLDKPAMARKYSYYIKKMFHQWGFTTVVTSQYAITTSEAFGFGVEHIADGIIRFRRRVRGGVLRRYLLIEKMRQTPHDLRVHEVTVEDGRGLVILGPVALSREDFALPEGVMRKIKEVSERAGVV